VLELFWETSAGISGTDQRLRVNESKFNLVVVVAALLQEINGFSSIEHCEGCLLINEVRDHFPHDLVLILPEPRHRNSGIVIDEELSVGIGELTFVNPLVNKLEKGLDCMSEKSVEQVIALFVSLRSIGIEDRNYLAAPEGGDCFGNDSHPFQSLEWFERPQSKLA